LPWQDETFFSDSFAKSNHISCAIAEHAGAVKKALLRVARIAIRPLRVRNLGRRRPVACCPSYTFRTMTVLIRSAIDIAALASSGSHQASRLPAVSPWLSSKAFEDKRGRSTSWWLCAGLAVFGCLSPPDSLADDSVLSPEAVVLL
jgi:hypothetical protein